MFVAFWAQWAYYPYTSVWRGIGVTSMLGHLVFNGHLDDGHYNSPDNGGLLKRLWHALLAALRA
jgi:hypothetical protein